MWKYIDEYNSLPDCNSVHCDTRDFHVLVLDEEDQYTVKRLNRYATAQHRFNQTEILGFLKTLEEHTGGKGSWRFIKYHGEGAWRKYFRFYKVGTVELLGKTVGEYVGYFGDSIEKSDLTADIKANLISRIKHDADNIVADPHTLNHISKEDD